MGKVALLSVTNKQGIAPLAQWLEDHGWSILSSGGTARHLRESGIAVIDVADYTGSPELLDGRVKTLHPKIHAGILARDTTLHLDELDKHHIDAIDLVVCNLYDFENAQKQNLSEEEIVEAIDVGGPSMIRAAAKNYERVWVVVDPLDYKDLIMALDHGSDQKNIRRSFAAKAFSFTAHYDALISQYFAQGQQLFPDRLVWSLKKKQELRYGENPHQKSALYVLEPSSQSSLVNARQLQGKELSYNNYLDMEHAWGLVSEFENPAVAIIKHTNPAGLAVRHTIEDALEAAHSADPLSAFGCVIALNRVCSEDFANRLKGWFVEVIIAPSFSAGALKVLGKKANLRLMEKNNGPGKQILSRHIDGGLLLQTSYDFAKMPPWQHVCGPEITAGERADIALAWIAVGHVKSNAIVIVKDQIAVGVGAGQMSRVDAAKIAVEKAGPRAKGAVAASDAFFPFSDGLGVLAKAGVRVIISPGGSVKDDEVIARAKELGITMIFTGKRMFRH